MKLREEIKRFKEKTASQIPVEAGNLMADCTRELLESKIASKALHASDTAPSFELPNAVGNIVSSATLLAKGPLVVSFYRGAW